MVEQKRHGTTRRNAQDEDESLEETVATDADAEQLEHPERIGRYRIQRVLGSGGFGLVYLAYDEQLDRPVALKVPHARRIARPADAESYLVEARNVARLDHSHIVPVLDVGSTDQHPCYVVSKYIEGTDFAVRLKISRPHYSETAELAATVAEALHHAHKHGLVHRDIKPANILLSTKGEPFIVDFGVALREQEIGHGRRFAGTPAYMSPEQARGEGHRVDGRSDVYSLGAVFYEALTGRRTFTAASKSELLEQIASLDPKPPRQVDDNIPKELERICLKALARRSAERYTTAQDMADDLRQFLADYRLRHPLERAVVLEQSAAESGSLIAARRTDPSTGWRTDSAHQAIRVIPKGLRAFDEHDADFFLELLPGPRDRHGMPDSLRFWKTRIEQMDPESTFSVGLIYGPSGCGKTSLVKAGLLPRLAEDVISIYLEATPQETEMRLLRGLRKRLPALDRNLGLKESLAAVRRGEGLPSGKKVLIILDQFEQWLHANSREENTELVLGLRQCDGGSLQCLLMVRDDFWMAVTRFLRELEIRLVEGHNLAAVDLFPERHAYEVLAAFGQAFGALPEARNAISKEERQFLKEAVAALSDEGKVICVRLALFAEMMKGKPWIPAILEQVGGAQGVGVTFLTETFNSATASPEHRYHERAARAVLKALLPEAGAEIKGKMKSRAELLEASGYADRPRDFADLLTILDAEIRLITPTDPSEGQANQSTPGSSEPAAVHYQLTHDYLVEPLREWLTRKQKETLRGRTEIRLNQRAAIWNARPENRHLPSVIEYASIMALTSRKSWSEPEARMMQAATRWHRAWAAVASLFLLALVITAVIAQERADQLRVAAEVDRLVDQLIVADVAELPGIAAELDDKSELAAERLEAIADDADRPASERVRAAFALANSNPASAQRLLGHAESAELQMLQAIRQRLKPHAEKLRAKLWENVQRENITMPALLRISVLLAGVDPQSEKWQQVAPELADALLSENTLDLDAWAEVLRPAAPALTPVLREHFYDSLATSAERDGAARVLARFADAPLLAELLLEADASRFEILLRGAYRETQEVISTIRKAVDDNATPASDDSQLQHARRMRNAALVFLRLARLHEAQPLLASSTVPTARTMLMLEMRDFGVSAETILSALEVMDEPAARQALIAALEPYRERDLTAPMEQKAIALLLHQWGEGEHQSPRSAAEWLLRQWGHEETVSRMFDQLPVSTNPPESVVNGRQDWWITPQGHTMLMIRGPVALPPAMAERDEQNQIPYSFAVGVYEVTVEQFLRFKPDLDYAGRESSPNPAANKIYYEDAIAYCRWLSEQEGIPKEEICYRAGEEYGPRIPDDVLRRSGYRLLTEREWEYVCRAGTSTPWFCGVSEGHLPHFAWYAANSQNDLKAVGLRLPNPLGLFDIIGNVGEWCHASGPAANYILRGGAYNNFSDVLRSDRRYEQSTSGYSYTGLRLARTITPSSDQ